MSRTDSSNGPNLRQLNGGTHSSSFPVSRVDLLQSYAFPENGTDTQKAMVKAASENFGGNTEIQRLLYELVKVANELQ